MGRGKILLLATGIFIADRLIKIWVAHTLTLGQSITVMPGLLWITYIVNQGAAFGLFPNATPVFIAVAVVLLGMVAVTLWRYARFSRLSGWGIGLLAGGALGNLWDRVVSGQVIDYIHVRDYAIFNLADSAIVVGMIFWVADQWRNDRRIDQSDSAGERHDRS